MKEIPILFSAPMVQAIGNGSKCQTRRVVKPQPIDNQQVDGHFYAGDHSTAVMMDGHPNWREQFAFQAARWQKGDHLWVKETFAETESDGGPVIAYRAGGTMMHCGRGSKRSGTWEDFIVPGDPGQVYEPERWKPSIFMPRWASRTTLLVEQVRVERLQDLSEEDAIAEGIEGWEDRIGDDVQDYWTNYNDPAFPGLTSPIESYRSLWNTINLAPTPILKAKVIVGYECYPWSAEDFDAAYPGVREAGTYRGKPIAVTPNPWVWVVEFTRIDPNSNKITNRNDSSSQLVASS